MALVFEFVSKKKPTDYIDVYIYDDHAVIKGREHDTAFLKRVTTLEGWGGSSRSIIIEVMNISSRRMKRHSPLLFRN